MVLAVVYSKLVALIFLGFSISGVCYGFEVMSNSESPNVPFTILRTRFSSGMKFLYWAVRVCLVFYFNTH